VKGSGASFNCESPKEKKSERPKKRFEIERNIEINTKSKPKIQTER
jgi:hypothetical protein